MDVASYDLISTAVLFLDGDGCVEHANTAAEELFSVSRRQLIGQPVHSLFGSDDALAERLPDAIAGRFGILRQDLVVDRRGERVAISLAVVPLDKQPWSALVERSEEHTSELQSLMRISYAVFCLKKKKK